MQAKIAADTSNFEALSGRGIRGRIAEHEIAIGNERLLSENGIRGQGLHNRADSLRHEGHTVMFVAIDGRPAGLVGVADPIKSSTLEAIRALRSEGIRIVMITGDN